MFSFTAALSITGVNVDPQADGIVLKNGGERSLIDCLDKIAAGGRWIPQDLLVRASALREKHKSDPLNTLSERERELSELVAQGLRNRAIAEEIVQDAFVRTLDRGDEIRESVVGWFYRVLRNAVIGIVGLIIAGALVALALLGNDSELSILAMLAAAVIGSLMGLFLYSQGWIWGSRAARRREAGSSVAIALGGGLMALVAAVALAGLLILLLLFFIG